MSRGVHAVQHEVEHKIEHEAHLENGVSSLNKKVALLIAVLALFLAFAETLGKSAQTAALSHQIVASNLWDLFQAKKDREVQHRIAADELRVSLTTVTDPREKAAIEAKIAEWEKTADRYHSEPERREGTVELQPRASAEEHMSKEKLSEYHHYELASAVFQIGIVLASALVLTGLARWSFPIGGLLIAVGLAFMGFALFAPHVLPLH